MPSDGEVFRSFATVKVSVRDNPHREQRSRILPTSETSTQKCGDSIRAPEPVSARAPRSRSLRKLPAQLLDSTTIHPDVEKPDARCRAHVNRICRLIEEKLDVVDKPEDTAPKLGVEVTVFARNDARPRLRLDERSQRLHRLAGRTGKLDRSDRVRLLRVVRAHAVPKSRARIQPAVPHSDGMLTIDTSH